MDAREMARVLGRRGGLARAGRLPEDERRRIASLGGRARKESLTAARRIEENLRYAAAVAGLGTPTPIIRRSRTCRGPLPGLYRER